MKPLGSVLLALSLLLSGCLESHPDPARDARNQAMVAAVENIPIGTSSDKVTALLKQYSIEYSWPDKNHLIGILRDIGPSNSVLVEGNIQFNFYFDLQNNLASKKFEEINTGM